MTTTAHDALARRFRALHTASRPLALANAWDVASARVVEAAGAPAIATTSAGVAWSLGRPDGDALSREEALGAIRRIAAAVTVPVTVDIESGYGADTTEAGETVRQVLEAGAVGINLEDGTRPPAELAARIRAARAAADAEGLDLFVNARVDTYLFGLGPEADRLADTLDRARQYVDAGADGVFVPGVTDLDVLAALAAKIPVPLNAMAGPGAPAVPELGRAGVARVSLGAGVAQAAYTAAHRATVELLGTGGYGPLAGALDFGELNALLAAGPGAGARGVEE